MTLFLLVYANVYGHIKSVSEISIKKKDPYSAAAMSKCVCALVCV